MELQQLGPTKKNVNVLEASPLCQGKECACRLSAKAHAVNTQRTTRYGRNDLRLHTKREEDQALAESVSESSRHNM